MQIKSLLLIVLTTPQLHALTTEQAYFQLAQALKDEGKKAQALVEFQHVLERNSNNIQALMELATLEQENKNFELALCYYEKILGTNAKELHTLVKAGICSIQLGHIEKAIDYYQRALELEPSSIDYHVTLGLLFKKNHSYEKSLFIVEKALLLNPTNLKISKELIHLNCLTNHYEQALKICTHALSITPTDTQLLFEKANIHINLNQPQQALDIYHPLLDMQPDSVQLKAHCACALKKLHNYEQAIEYYLDILKHQPNNAHIHTQLAYTYCTIGALECGFNEFFTSAQIEYKHKLLTTLDNIAGKTIFIPLHWCYEDVLHFIRYAQVLHEKGAKVIVQSYYPLIPLLKQCPYIATVLAPEHVKIPHYDAIAPVTMLPALCNASDLILANIPYIYPDSALLHAWRKKLNTTQSYKIGIFWQMHEPDNRNDHKNIPMDYIKQFAAVPKSSLYLLHGLSDYDKNYMPDDMIITTIGKGITTFDHTNIETIIALVSCMDLIITRDSLLAHIAGALGKPVFVGLSYHADWRWMRNRSDSPWYPNMTLFRQPSNGDWQSVVTDMVTTLTL